MKRAISALCLLLCATASLAKEKPKTTIQVVDTQNSTRQYAYYVPGASGESTTDCSGNATAINLGGAVTTANGRTNCTTTSTPGTPASKVEGYVSDVYVHAIMPDGRHITLWCDGGSGQCVALSAGYYESVIKGNSVWVYSLDLGGKKHKPKYRYVGGW